MMFFVRQILPLISLVVPIQRCVLIINGNFQLCNLPAVVTSTSTKCHQLIKVTWNGLVIVQSDNKFNDLFRCICLFCFPSSSNGKTVTWAQNERGSRGNHLWKRLSFHIKKRESNQTAVIKPFSKGPETRYGGDVTPESSTKMLYEVSEAEEHYPGAYQPQTPSPISTVSQRAAVLARGHEDLPTATYRGEQQHSPQNQGSIMDQISCVVNRFTANISELNSMMLASTPVPVPPGAAETFPPTFLIPREIQLPTTMTTFAEVQPVPPAEADSCQPVAGRASPASDGDTPPGSPTARSDLEELATLTPPSPFRDSVGSASGSPTSPVSESALCIPASPKYERLVLRDYSQSSSSL